jgi:hypothetical protein
MPWRRMGEWMYRFTFSWLRHWLEMSGQLHAPPSLPPGTNWIGGWVDLPNKFFFYFLLSFPNIWTVPFFKESISCLYIMILPCTLGTRYHVCTLKAAYWTSAGCRGPAVLLRSVYWEQPYLLSLDRFCVPVLLIVLYKDIIFLQNSKEQRKI